VSQATPAKEPIVVHRHIAASPATVYGYLTQSDKWARWQGIAATIEPTVGGLFAMAMPNGLRARGQIVDLVPNRRVVFTWGWIDHPGLPPGSSTVTIDLTQDDFGTLLTLTHSELPADEIPIHVMGWEHYVPRLAAAAEGRDPGPDTGPG
jgi:uncharacterized protein YndB with AHSA1/START domain